MEPILRCSPPHTLRLDLPGDQDGGWVLLATLRKRFCFDLSHDFTLLNRNTNKLLQKKWEKEWGGAIPQAKVAKNAKKKGGSRREISENAVVIRLWDGVKVR